MNRFILLSFVIITFSLASAKVPENSKKNHELLSKIGFTRVKAPNSHHRKRLAVESRHSTRSDDSHMFIIKLPPNQHYYVHNKPTNFVEPKQNVPIGFKGNGKPGKIYHWNMPVMKKIAKNKAKHNNQAQYKRVDENWNEVLEKPVHHIRSNKKPSYYVPSKPKKSSFFKYFPGNGKPNSFYVIEKNKKLHHHKLLS